MNPALRISDIVKSEDLRIGTGFEAKHFGEQMFNGLIDPVVMLDHFHMTSPTFEVHPHAGLSAVTYVFEDSKSAHVNYDSLGNYGPIHPGALHWFVAGRGAVHTEQPEGDAPHVHALQIFVNLPARKKMDAPYAVHIEPSDIPEFKADGVRVRVVLGSSNGVHATHTEKLPEPFTLLDGFLSTAAPFTHTLPANWNAMVYAVSGGRLQLETNGQTSTIACAHAFGICASNESTDAARQIHLSSDAPAHFVILSGPALREPLVKHGPFVMNTMEQIHDCINAYQRGDFGALKLPQG